MMLDKRILPILKKTPYHMLLKEPRQIHNSKSSPDTINAQQRSKALLFTSLPNVLLSEKHW